MDDIKLEISKGTNPPALHFKFDRPRIPKERLTYYLNKRIIYEEDTCSEDHYTPVHLNDSEVELENIQHTRKDRFNNSIIKSKNKKMLAHKVTFVDQVNSDTELETQHFVLSYKSYNAQEWYQIDDLR